MESFARSRNLDPLVAETWYSIIDDLRKQKVCEQNKKQKKKIINIVFGVVCQREKKKEYGKKKQIKEKMGETRNMKIQN